MKTVQKKTTGYKEENMKDLFGKNTIIDVCKNKSFKQISGNGNYFIGTTLTKEEYIRLVSCDIVQISTPAFTRVISVLNKIPYENLSHDYLDVQFKVLNISPELNVDAGSISLVPYIPVDGVDVDLVHYPGSGQELDESSITTMNTLYAPFSIRGMKIF